MLRSRRTIKVRWAGKTKESERGGGGGGREREGERESVCV